VASGNAPPSSKDGFSTGGTTACMTFSASFAVRSSGPSASDAAIVSSGFPFASASSTKRPFAPAGRTTTISIVLAPAWKTAGITVALARSIV